MSRPIGPSGPGVGFRVEPDQLAVLARAMRAVADRVQEATGHALPVPLEAYGRIGQLFVGDAINAADTAILAVGRLAEANRRAADDLDAEYADYLAVERENTALFSGIHC
jgi:hypothetical protein